LVLRTKKKLNTLKDIFSLHNGLKYILKEPPNMYIWTYLLTCFHEVFVEH